MNCWDAKHPSVKSLFNNRDGDIILSSFQIAADVSPPLLVGWNELVCADQWKVLHHMVYQNREPNSNFVEIFGHIIRVVKIARHFNHQSHARGVF